MKVNHVNQLRPGFQVTLLNVEAKTEVNNSIYFISLLNLSAESTAQWSVTGFTLIGKKKYAYFVKLKQNRG